MPTIFVCLRFAPSHPRLALEVEASETIDNIKAKLAEVTGIPPDRQHLRPSDQPGLWQGMKDGRMLSDYDIHDGGVIEMAQYVVLAQPHREVGAYVAGFAGHGDFMLHDVRASDTIDSIKAKIQEVTGIPSDRLRLCLSDGLGAHRTGLARGHRTLSYYHIDDYVHIECRRARYPH